MADVQLKVLVGRFEAYAEAYFAELDWPPRLLAAARHAFFGGGKRVRPALALLAAEAVAGLAGPALPWALAVELARSGAKVAISDVNPEGLAITAERLRAIGADVKADRLDVSDGAAFAAYAESVNEHFGKVNQIYNNAGMGFYGDVEITRLDEIKRVMDVDYWGVVH